MFVAGVRRRPLIVGVELPPLVLFAAGVALVAVVFVASCVGVDWIVITNNCR